MESKKVGVMWFEFLFDKSGSLLPSHLSSPNADPTALQLIQQFLEKSRSITLPSGNGQERQEAGEMNTKRKGQLLLLAIHAASHLEWNLNILESGIPFYEQYILLQELVKMCFKQAENDNSTPDLTKMEKNAIIPLLLYHRWTVRAIVKESSSNSKHCENKANEASSDGKGSKTDTTKLLSQLKEEEQISVNILQQAVAWKQDLNFPVLPLLKWAEEKEDSSLSNEEASKGNSEKEIPKDSPEKDSSQNDSQMDTSAPPGQKIISSQEVIGQICFDLGALYFYKEDIEKAKGLFEICSAVQCPSSSFYTVDKKKLSGYYTACCSLLHCPVRGELVSHQSLMSRMEQSKYDGYKNLVSLLVKDNIEQEVPYSYRKCLEADVMRMMQHNQLNVRVENTIVWQVCCCNIIGILLAGRCVDAESWRKIANSTKDQFEIFVKLCTDSVSKLVHERKAGRLFKLQEAIRSLLVGKFGAEKLEVLLNSDIGELIGITKYKKALEKSKEEQKTCDIHVSVFAHQTHPASRNDIQIQISQLEHELKTTSCPSQVPNVLMQLHGLDPDPHKKHAKGHENPVYGPYIQDLKDDILQDIFHVLFSKANQCTQRKDYVQAKSFLDFGFQTIQEQRKRYGNTATFDKMSNFLSQEILVTNILKAEENREKVSDDLLRRIKSNFSYTMSDYSPRPHVVEVMVIYLLNVKEWGILAELDCRGATGTSLDYKELACSIAGVSLNLSKPTLWRKLAKIMWDSILRVFTSTVQHKRMLPDGTIIDIKRDAGNLPYFVKFISKLKEETCLSLIISCLERIRSLEPPNDSEKEQNNFIMYNHLWPTSIPSSGNTEFNQIGLALLEAIDHSVNVHPFNSSFLKIQGDTFYENENHLNALRCYVQAGAASSDFFELPVPKSVWDNAVYRKMIACCSAFNSHTQVAVLCQYLEPLDYNLAFSAMKQTTRNDASEFYYDCIWDVTLLEFIVDIHNKRGEHDKKQVAIQALGQTELNSCNPPEILQCARRIRSRRFLQVFAKQYL